MKSNLKFNFMAVLTGITICGNLYAGYNPTVGRFLKRDPIDEKGAQLLHGIKGDGVKGSVESYTFVKNNPISNWDYLGLAAWCHRHKWTRNYIDGYHDYVASGYKHYIGVRRDCADLALDILIDYAYAYNLPLTISNGSGQQKSGDAKYHSVSQYREDVFRRTATVDIHQRNTVKIPNVTMLKPGDLTTSLHPGRGYTGHTRVVFAIDFSTDPAMIKYIAGGGHSGTADAVVQKQERAIPGATNMRRWRFWQVGLWHKSEGRTDTP